MNFYDSFYVNRDKTIITPLKSLTKARSKGVGRRASARALTVMALVRAMDSKGRVVRVKRSHHAKP